MNRPSASSLDLPAAKKRRLIQPINEPIAKSQKFPENISYQSAFSTSCNLYNRRELRPIAFHKLQVLSSPYLLAFLCDGYLRENNVRGVYDIGSIVTKYIFTPFYAFDYDADKCKIELNKHDYTKMNCNFASTVDLGLYYNALRYDYSTILFKPFLSQLFLWDHSNININNHNCKESSEVPINYKCPSDVKVNSNRTNSRCKDKLNCNYNRSLKNCGKNNMINFKIKNSGCMKIELLENNCVNYDRSGYEFEVGVICIDKNESEMNNKFRNVYFYYDITNNNAYSTNKYLTNKMVQCIQNDSVAIDETDCNLNTTYKYNYFPGSFNPKLAIDINTYTVKISKNTQLQHEKNCNILTKLAGLTAQILDMCLSTNSIAGHLNYCWQLTDILLLSDIGQQLQKIRAFRAAIPHTSKLKYATTHDVIALQFGIGRLGSNKGIIDDPFELFGENNPRCQFIRPSDARQKSIFYRKWNGWGGSYYGDKAQIESVNATTIDDKLNSCGDWDGTLIAGKDVITVCVECVEEIKYNGRVRSSDKKCNKKKVKVKLRKDDENDVWNNSMRNNGNYDVIEKYYLSFKKNDLTIGISNRNNDDNVSISQWHKMRKDGRILLDFDKYEYVFALSNKTCDCESGNCRSSFDVSMTIN